MPLRARPASGGSVALLAIPAVLAVGSPARAAGQPAPAAATAAASGPTIDDVVRAALATSPRVLGGARVVEQYLGAMQQAAAPFDGRVRSTVGAERDNSVVFAGMGDDGVGRSAVRPVPSSLARQTYALGFDQQLRSGVVVSPQLAVAQSSGAVGAAVGTASVGVRVTLPLLNNRGGVVLRAAERAAGLDHDGAVHDFVHLAAVAVRDAAVAYWDYHAAHLRRAVYAEAAERAGRLVEETRHLVRADERPAVDTQQVLANLATKRATRLGAEQGVVAAREALGLALGLPAPEVLALAAPASDFPSPPEAPVGDAPAAALLDTARARRADLRAARLRVAAAEADLVGATSALRPRLDVVVGAGYVGLAAGGGLAGFVAPLHENVPGMNTTVQLSYQIPTTNAAARGRRVQADAGVAQQLIAAQDVARRVETGVAVAGAALRTSALALEQARLALALSHRAVANERQKFQLGTATMFDIINAEDALTSALLGEIGARRAYAVAVADMRVATGTVTTLTAGQVVASPSVMTAAP